MRSSQWKYDRQAAGFEPPRAYLVRGRLNALAWRLPVPHRVASRLSQLVYRNPPISGQLVVEVLSTLGAANVSCWIRGGWGVDALVGRNTRSHDDLDLLVDEEDLALAVTLLERMGFKEHYRVDSDRPLFSRVVMHDHELAGRTVDLQPIERASMEWAFASGIIDGSPVPCVSREFQIAHRAGYRHRRVDRKDLAVLRASGASTPVVRRRLGAFATSLSRAAASLAASLTGAAATSLIVPVPAAQSLLDSSARVRGMPAHITVMYPFLRSREMSRGERRRLAGALAKVPAFELTASSIGRFPNVVYLKPEPASSFVAITQAVMALWPQVRPYEGEFQEIVPHLTVSYGDQAPIGIGEQLPITAPIEEVWLMRRLGRGWVRSARIPLGARSGSRH